MCFDQYLLGKVLHKHGFYGKGLVKFGQRPRVNGQVQTVTEEQPENGPRQEESAILMVHCAIVQSQLVVGWGEALMQNGRFLAVNLRQDTRCGGRAMRTGEKFHEAEWVFRG